MLANTGQIGDDVDAVGAQMLGGADAGKHQGLGCTKRPLTQDDLATRAKLVATDGLHADSTPALKLDSRHMASGQHFQILRHPPQIGDRRRLACAPSDVAIRSPHPGSFSGIEVIQIRMAIRDRSLDECPLQDAKVCRASSCQRTIGTMPSVTPRLCALGPTKVRQQVGKAPAFQALLTPSVIVAGHTTHVDHAIQN